MRPRALSMRSAQHVLAAGVGLHGEVAALEHACTRVGIAVDDDERHVLAPELVRDDQRRSGRRRRR